MIVGATKGKRLFHARDSTRVHQLEQMRSDFVANVSHELRTPLTVIGGYVESLLDLPQAHRAPFNRALPQIHQQTRRMQGLVTDLLLLSHLELDQKGTKERAAELMAANNVIGFSTYGEQYNAMHVNQTLTGVAIGRARRS